ncbi:MAG: hypothetical protein EOP84_00610 [Verrucomicrobiaceae bacterium]|nr:MAG: hypothetical protein EOP84_00610 [Verrucomicrobiaceae bacterium]
MIDPVNSLSFSMHANKGVYAVLIGSGVSRAARIPTGWEVTIELVRKTAAIQKANCEPAPEAWYRQVTGNDPDYSVLLDAVAKTPAERQQLLRPYFEPTEEERAEGAKAPTKAHRAIARLVKLGYVRVIITTNFDRLLEVALQDEGIQPAVLSTADQIAGAMPLVHTACTVIKVHGDYLDTRILNTPDELATYPEAFNKLLDRVFDEFGLIVSGWSADWDVALRAAIVRAPNRRFSTYWSSRGDPSSAAADLIGRRAGILLRSPDADSFFTTLAEQVQALEDFSAPHPLSSVAAVAALKRYLSEPKYKISLHDLIRRQVDQVVAATKGPRFNLQQPTPNAASLLDRLKGYEAVCQTLVQLAHQAGFWSDGTQLAPWLSTLRRLAQQPMAGGYELWITLRAYPASLLLYSFGVGAIQSGNYRALQALFAVRVQELNDTERHVGAKAALWTLGGEKFKLLHGRENEHTPLHNHTGDYLFEQLKRFFDNDKDFHLHFDEFEVFLALNIGAELRNAENHFWVPPGAYGWRRENTDAVLKKLRASMTTSGGDSPYVATNLIGNDVKTAEATIIGFENFISRLGWRW